VVQSADLRDRDHRPAVGCFDLAGPGGIAVQRQMTASFVIVLKVRGQDVLEMGFTQDDHLIQTFTADGADHPFAIRILPGRVWCNQDFFDAHVLDAFLEVVAIDAISIPQEKPRRLLVRECVDNLLGGPFGIGIRGHVEMDDLSPVMAEHDEDVQDTEGHGGNREEVAGGDIGNVIGQECSPRLRGRFTDTDHVLGHSPFRNVVLQQEQFRQDSRCAPGGILTGNAANQFPDFAINAWPPYFAGPRLPPPIQFETLAMPAGVIIESCVLAE